MHRAVKSSSRVIHEYDLDREKTAHEKRLQHISSSIDNSEPVTYNMPHLKVNRKKELLLQEHTEEINRMNALLVKRMISILASHPENTHAAGTNLKAPSRSQTQKCDSPRKAAIVKEEVNVENIIKTDSEKQSSSNVHDPKSPSSKKKNYSQTGHSRHVEFVRKKKLKQIADDNIEIFNRIQNAAPYYDKSKIDDDWEKNCKYLKSISFFPVHASSPTQTTSKKNQQRSPRKQNLERKEIKSLEAVLSQSTLAVNEDKLEGSYVTEPPKCERIIDQTSAESDVYGSFQKTVGTPPILPSINSLYEKPLTINGNLFQQEVFHDGANLTNVNFHTSKTSKPSQKSITKVIDQDKKVIFQKEMICNNQPIHIILLKGLDKDSFGFEIHCINYTTGSLTKRNIPREEIADMIENNSKLKSSDVDNFSVDLVSRLVHESIAFSDSVLRSGLNLSPQGIDLSTPQVLDGERSLKNASDIHKQSTNDDMVSTKISTTPHSEKRKVKTDLTNRIVLLKRGQTFGSRYMTVKVTGLDTPSLDMLAKLDLSKEVNENYFGIVTYDSETCETFEKKISVSNIKKFLFAFVGNKGLNKKSLSSLLNYLTLKFNSKTSKWELSFSRRADEKGSKESDIAATQIQKHMKGKLARKRFKTTKTSKDDEKKQTEKSATIIQAHIRGYLSRHHGAYSQYNLSTIDETAVMIPSINENRFSIKEDFSDAKKITPDSFIPIYKKRNSYEDIVKREDFAATRIQARVRGTISRKRLRTIDENSASSKTNLEQTNAATKIQAQMRGRFARKYDQITGSDKYVSSAAKNMQSTTAKSIVPSNVLLQDQSKAATKIQARIRGNTVRKSNNATHRDIAILSKENDKERPDSKENDMLAVSKAEVESNAAKGIQRQMRGRIVRNLGMTSQKVDDSFLQDAEGNFYDLNEEEPISPTLLHIPLRQQSDAATKIQARVRGKLARRNEVRDNKPTVSREKHNNANLNAEHGPGVHNSNKESGKQTSAATKIQAHMRGKIARKSRHDIQGDTVALTPDKTNEFSDSKQPNIHLLVAEDAAVKIQSHLRGNIARRTAKTNKVITTKVYVTEVAMTIPKNARSKDIIPLSTISSIENKMNSE